jgi:type III restriction enzyme
MRLRSYALDEAREAVLRLAKLRPPQREAFDKVHSLIKSLDRDLAETSPEDVSKVLRSLSYGAQGRHPHLVFVLATGVGKTRLMGALIAYLYRAGQSRNFLILAPRTAILEKLERESQVGHQKYLLIDASLVPEPNVCLRESLESFSPQNDRPNILILSPQSITGKDKRFARGSEFRGFSVLEYLRSIHDLVLFVDEAHHIDGIGADDPAAWAQAVGDIAPRLYFGFTATPRDEASGDIAYSYDLATCLREGQ